MRFKSNVDETPLFYLIVAA